MVFGPSKADIAFEMVKYLSAGRVDRPTRDNHDSNYCISVYWLVSIIIYWYVIWLKLNARRDAPPGERLRQHWTFQMWWAEHVAFDHGEASSQEVQVISSECWNPQMISFQLIWFERDVSPQRFQKFPTHNCLTTLIVWVRQRAHPIINCQDSTYAAICEINARAESCRHLNARVRGCFLVRINSWKTRTRMTIWL